MTAKNKRSGVEYTEAYMDYYPVVFSSILAKTGNRDDAEDICQDIFYIFFEKFGTIENKRSWLYGTMKNKLYKYYQKKNPEADIDEIFNDVGITFTNGFRDTRILIDEAIESIECSETDRMLLDLIAKHNYSYSNTARAVGLTRRQVEYRYSQLVKEIMDNLMKQGIKDITELL